MPPDPQVIAAVTAASEADPESTALRLHLASVLLDDGRAADALPHVEFVLGREPENVEALLQACRACEALGDPRADTYRQLATAISTGREAADPGRARAGAARPPGPPGGAPSRTPKSAPVIPDGPWSVERPVFGLSSVGGMEHVKKRFEVAFLAPLRNPDIREAFGKSLRGGMLMFGPPGCGKTFIARALAGELGVDFIKVNLAEVLGPGPASPGQAVQAIFGLARRQSPAVLFFDDLGIVRHHQAGAGEEAARQLKSQLIAEMDGEEVDNGGLLILAASDHPWESDPALLREGLFDRATLVLPPDRAARLAILQHHLAARAAGDLDVARLNERLEGYSGADIARLCETASLLATGSAAGAGAPAPITGTAMEMAAAVTPSSTPAWFETARHHALFANHTGVYDDLVTYMRSRRLV